MEKISKEFDPLTGVLTETGMDQLTGRFVVKHKADIAPSIEYAKSLQKDDDLWKGGVKKGFALAGHIPAMTVVELMQIGVNVYTASFKEIREGLQRLGKEGFIWKS